MVVIGEVVSGGGGIREREGGKDEGRERAFEGPSLGTDESSRICPPNGRIS